jgi:hypothetical protein
MTGPSCSWGIEMRGPGPPGWGSLKWNSKMWSRVLRDSDARMTANYRSKLQTRPYVGEGTPQHEDRRCPTVIKIWSSAPDGCPTPGQTGQLTVGLTITWTCVGPTVRQQLKQHCVAQWLRLALPERNQLRRLLPVSWRRKQIQFPKKFALQLFKIPGCGDSDVQTIDYSVFVAFLRFVAMLIMCSIDCRRYAHVSKEQVKTRRFVVVYGF